MWSVAKRGIRLHFGINSQCGTRIGTVWPSGNIRSTAQFGEMDTLDGDADRTFGIVHGIDIIPAFILEEIRKNAD